MHGFSLRLPHLLLVVLGIFVFTACDSAPASPQAPATAVAVQTQPTVAAPTAVPPTAVPAQPTVAPAAPTAVPAAPTAVPAASKSVTVLVGAGKETSDVNAYFPTNVKIHAGDKVVWKLNGDELHTVTFSDGKALPGALPDSTIPDPRLGAGGSDVLPYFAVKVPGGGPGDFMVNPQLAFPTRPPVPNAPAESFGGTGYASSGIMQNQPPAPNAPPNNTFELTFPKPGIYNYICLVHLSPMLGTVEVVASSVADVPTQSDLDTQAKKEMQPLLGLLDKARAEIKDPQKDAGPNNTSFWYVHAGGNEFIAGEPRAQVLEFGPKSLTVKSGDTVIWGSTYFHTVTFNPAPPPPDFILPKPQPNGPPQLLLNPLIGAPARPAVTYDPSKLYNSGIIGPFGQANSWALTFDKPGTYDYFCAVHRDEGMKATIIVQAK